MSFSKVICVVDEDVDVQDLAQVAWRVLANLDPKRDVSFVDGPVDQLDHGASQALWGGKMAIDGTKKWPEEGYKREWPDVCRHDACVERKVDAMWKELGIPLAGEKHASSRPIAKLEERASAKGEHADGNRAMFDRLAPSYDLMNRVMTAGIDRRWRARTVAMLRGVEGPILDLCAGTLDLSAMIEEAMPRSRVVACDASPRMLEAGRRKVKRVESVVGDALALPFDDASFGAVVCGFGVRNLADLHRGLAEVRRVLRPGGTFITLELFRPKNVATRALHGAGLRFALPVLGGAIAKDKDAYAYLAESMSGFVTREDYEHALRAHGFASVDSVDLVLGVASIVRARVPALSVGMEAAQ
jgi:ubiquinone/menaquinone biosynthesis methyltransferase